MMSPLKKYYDILPKKILLAVLLFSLTFSASVFAENTVIKTYILSGQSNGNGYGLAVGETDSGTLVPNQDLNDIGRNDLLPENDSVLIYQGGWADGIGEWGNLKPGYASWNGIRFGPELSFGHKIQSELDEPIALIKYTPNGTSLYFHWLEERYDLLMTTIDNAKTSANERGLTLDIQGILWMQGESDSFGAAAPVVYEQRLTTFITKVRDGLAIPDLKFHIAEIADSTAWRGRETIWAAQAAVVAADDNAYLVKSRNFPLFVDDASGSRYIHFSSEGTVMLGEAFASSVVGREETPSTTEPEIDGASLSHAVSDGAITIDGNLDDWNDITSLGYDDETLQDAGIKADFLEGWLAHDNHNLYVAYRNNGDIDTMLRWPWQVYFDTDGAASTGMKIDDQIGAEYMLQGAGVFKYTGSGTNWSWQYITNTSNAINGPIAEFKIPRLSLNFSDKLQILFKATNVAFTGSYASSGVDVYPKRFVPIPLQNDLLLKKSVVWSEPSGVLAMTLSFAASVGTTQLQTSEAHPLLDKQLLTYLSADGEYRTSQVSSTDGNIITLSKPLGFSIEQGQNLWNFYADDSHPNTFGYRAMVDYAIRYAGLSRLNTGKHVLLGDSWVDGRSSGFGAWLSERLSDAVIINRGISRSRSADVLRRFDSDLANQNPDFVWVAIGINDATSEIPVSDYLGNMQAILGKIRSIGATPMIFDSQVAQLFYGIGDRKTRLSYAYSEALANLGSGVKYQLSSPVSPPQTDIFSNPKTITIDGDLSDWASLESFGQDASDMNDAGAKADLLEAWMAHDDNFFYTAYKNDGDIDVSTWWPWQIYLDTDDNERTGFQIGNGVGTDYIIQGDALFSYIGSGNDWSWQFEEPAVNKVNGDIVELKIPRASINNPESLSLVLKTRNGIFTNNFTNSSIDSFPDLNQGHLNYQFSNTE